MDFDNNSKLISTKREGEGKERKEEGRGEERRKEREEERRKKVKKRKGKRQSFFFFFPCTFPTCRPLGLDMAPKKGNKTPQPQRNKRDKMENINKNTTGVQTIQTKDIKEYFQQLQL